MRHSVFCFVTLITIFAGLPSAADQAPVHLGPHFYFSPERPYLELRSVAEVRRAISSDLQQLVKGFSDCDDLIEGPLYRGRPRDSLRDTWTSVHVLRVECWATGQVDQDKPVSLAGTEDRLTPQIMASVVAHADRMSNANPQWAKVLSSFPQGDIKCKDAWRCTIYSSEGRREFGWPEQSVFVDLIFAEEKDLFLRVSPLVWGRASYAYGVRWRKTQAGGEVVDTFLGIDPP